MLALALVLTLEAAELPADYAPVRDQGNKASLLVYSAWSVVTLGTGIVGLAAPHDYAWQGAHIAHLVWGGVNTVIAAISLAVAFTGKPGDDPLQEGRNAQLSYAINAVFDVVSTAVSAALWLGPGRTDVRWQGVAAASLVQSAFLLAYDVTMSLYHQLNNDRVTR